jgi:hypothetical protein
MLKRQSKVLSIALIFVFCMSFMFAGFAAPQAAQAAGVTYTALTVPAVSDNTAVPQALGVIQVDIDNAAAIRAGDVLSISFPSEIDLTNAGAGLPDVLARSATTTDTTWTNLATNVTIDLPANVGSAVNALVTPGAAGPPLVSATDIIGSAAVTSTRTTLDITFNAPGTANAGRMLITFAGVRVGSIEGDIVATLAGPAGSVFSMGNVTVAKTVSDGDVMVSVKSEKTFGSAGGMTDTIIITELMQDSISAGAELKLRLPTGYSWANADPTTPTNASNGSYNWGWTTAARTAAGASMPWIAGTAAPGPGPIPLGVAILTPTTANSGDVMWSAGYGGAATNHQLYADPTDSRNLIIYVPAATNGATGSGQLRIHAWINIDDDVAKPGEITAVLSSNLDSWSDKELVVAKYGTFGVDVVEGTTKEIVAGKHDQKIGNFFIKEQVGNSIMNNRTVKVVLPKGVKWSGNYTTGVLPTPDRKKGNAALAVIGTPNNLASPYDVLKYRAASGGTKTEWEFKDFRVDVAPDFVGDLKIKVEGDAGVTGEVVVAKVIPAVDLATEQVTNVRIGEQYQALGDLIITETKKENISLRTATVNTFADFQKGAAAVGAQGPLNGVLELTLPRGSEWAPGYPKVEVLEGDLELKVNDMSKTANNRTIVIPVKSEGMKPAKIKVSDMKATIDRTVPEGDFRIEVTGAAINETGGEWGGFELAFPQFEGIKTVVAKCVTPAPGEGTEGAAAGQFKIDSNIYQLNGVAKVMDVAPYIKSGRTYVPVRYLAYALGVAEADVVWDEASQKVTLTKGDNVVELTIGNTSITVNGEAQAMDVAPEITNGRTMLPARYVAEGLGYVVGWDPGTRTVLISK